MEKALFSNFDSLPALLSTHDLINLGLYASIDAAYVARIRGQSPAFLKLTRKILYPKQSVIEFIEQRIHKGSHPDGVTTTPELNNNAE